MIFPIKYKCIVNNEFSIGNYKIAPLRFNDRSDIMQWRNDQIIFLRQSELLTDDRQYKYFDKILRLHFDEDTPNQLLFSFFENDKLIGYGGLVHVDWKSKNAEISFILKTDLNDEDQYFEKFTVYLQLISTLAKEIPIHKIYTYGYDLSEYRFKPLIAESFILEARLKQHKKLKHKLHDVLIYSKIL